MLELGVRGGHDHAHATGPEDLLDEVFPADEVPRRYGRSLLVIRRNRHCPGKVSDFLERTERGAIPDCRAAIAAPMGTGDCSPSNAAETEGLLESDVEV
jgi:hypothetical protein